jgi:DNA processing protein
VFSSEKIYQVALVFTPGVGGVLAKHLVSHCGSAQAIFESPRSKLLKIPHIGRNVAEILLNKEGLRKAEKELTSLENTLTEILFYTDKNFPARLNVLHDAPALLFYRGNADLNTARIVSVVGTRSATTYGKSFVEELVSSMNRYNNLLLVSGLAYGIDSFVHKNALTNNLPNIAVMGTGLDIIYPSAHRSLAEQITQNGGLLTEHPLGTKPDARHFPARNRIVAGMCDAVIVVEAAAKGGALITAEIANSYNKDVFAVPGNIGNKFSEGCNNLIKSHKAHLFTGLADLEYIMNWQSENILPKPKLPDLFETQLEEPEKKLLTLLQTQPGLMLDEISWQAQISIHQTASLLMNLELQGYVKALPGKKFTLA